MKLKNILLSGVAALSVLTACNDSFLEKNPIGSLGESNATIGEASGAVTIMQVS